MVDPAHLVGAGGALGALLRYGVNRAVDSEAFPAGTMTVNVLGSFALGLLTFAGADHGIVLFVGIGVCGSFTTFSSFSFETVRLAERGELRRAGAYAFGTLAASLSAIGVAWLVARAALGG